MHSFSDTDYTQRFIFDDSDVRGEMVSLDRSYAEVLAKHPYPEPVAQLLGELLAAASLLIATLKFDGMLTLQVRSEGPVSLLMIECSSDREVRGLAQYDADAISADATLATLIPDGVLTMTVFPRNGQRYQGIVALDGQTIAECFNDYFRQSEQLGTRFWLHADGRRVRGMLLQQLPADRIPDADERADSWAHVTALASTLSAEEMLSLDNETILHRLYHEEAVRLFDVQPVVFRCSCSRERSARALVSLGEEDLRNLLAENNGEVTIDCQFCNHTYRFDSSDISQLFAGGGAEEPSETRH